MNKYLFHQIPGTRKAVRDILLIKNLKSEQKQIFIKNLDKKTKVKNDRREKYQIKIILILLKAVKIQYVCNA